MSNEENMGVTLDEVDVPVSEEVAEVRATDPVAEEHLDATAAEIPVIDEEEALDEVSLENLFEPNEHVTVESSPFHPNPNKTRLTRTLSFLKLGMDDIDSIITKYNLDYNDPEQDRELPNELLRLKALLGNLSDTLQTNYSRNIDTRENSEWGQGVDNGSTVLRAGKARLRSDADPIMHLRNELGLGTYVQIPLWTSGIWITLRTPSDAAMLELEQRMSLEKSTLGYLTNGMVFSSTEIYTKTAILDFIFDHVVQVTLDSKDPKVLYSVIKDTDYPQLVWGMALACYPQGYPLLQPCVANPTTCNHVESLLLNLGRISWVDRSKFSTSQIAHMSNREKPMSLEKIEAYQREFEVTQRHGSVQIHPGVTLKLRVPTLAEARDIGYEWVDDIVTTTQKAFGKRINEGARENFMTHRALMASLRQYSQWFSAIVRTGAQEFEITDRKKIDEFIEMISADEEKVGLLYKVIRDFIDESTVSLIALPRYKCPACQGEPDEALLKHPRLIPLDVVQVFFTLRDQRVANKLTVEMNRRV